MANLNKYSNHILKPSRNCQAKARFHLWKPIHTPSMAESFNFLKAVSVFIQLAYYLNKKGIVGLAVE